MKKLVLIFTFLIGGLAFGQDFTNQGFENVTCATDCSSANSQMSCVDGWFENHVVAIDPLQKSFCNPDFVCTGDYSIMLSQTSGAPASNVKTENPFAGIPNNGIPQVLSLIHI